MTTIRDMQLFVTVVKAGSFSAAARQLGLSPASVSRHISALEEALSVRLFNRTSRSQALTEAGQIYHLRAEAILSDIEDMQQAVSQLEHAPRGTLRVHSRLMVGSQYIVPALPAFLARYPDIKIDLSMSNDVVHMSQQNVDVDIRIGRLEDSELIVRRLLSSERVLCASPLYLKRSPPLERPEDLSAHDCLTYRANLGPTVWRFLDSKGALTEVPVDGSIRIDNGNAILALARAGAGVALLHDWSIAEDIRDGHLQRLLPEFRVSYADFENGIYAVYQQSRHLSPKIRVFVDFMYDLFKPLRSAAGSPAGKRNARVKTIT